MNRLIAAVLVLFVSTSTSAIASEFEYELKVKGMVCAFCAYNLSKQLRSADGVTPESIKVDLAGGKVTLRSEKRLDAARLAELVQAAGFELEAVAEIAADSSTPAPRSERRVLLSLTVDARGLEEGEFDILLEAVGALASQRSAGVTVVGPAGLEMRALRPILMGRSPAMDVAFTESVRPDSTVLINVVVAPPPDAGAASYTVRGEITQFSALQEAVRRIFIRHEAIQHLVNPQGEVVGMAAMTMPFPVAPQVSLEGFEVGDKVEFTFRVDWEAQPPNEIVTLRRLPADSVLKLGPDRP